MLPDHASGPATDLVNGPRAVALQGSKRRDDTQNPPKSQPLLALKPRPARRKDAAPRRTGREIAAAAWAAPAEMTGVAGGDFEF